MLLMLQSNWNTDVCAEREFFYSKKKNKFVGKGVQYVKGPALNYDLNDVAFYDISLLCAVFFFFVQG